MIQSRPELPSDPDRHAVYLGIPHRLIEPPLTPPTVLDLLPQTLPHLLPPGSAQAIMFGVGCHAT